ncbi:MAG: glycoside hydrolase family 127 protein [Clostridia bacterium]|nr:glycoside hydrolase family 127 protein [Clostridia bacterium]
MVQLYKNGEANFPRLSTDKFFIDYNNTFSFTEITHKTMTFTEDYQLLKEDLWVDFVNQFRDRIDGPDAGWRGEYWGKMMRGACFVYSYTKNKKLLEILTATVRDILTTQDERGRISSYTVGEEFNGWDIWSRKYVLLGMQYFLEINEDKELEKEIIASMCRQADYLMLKLGNTAEGKLPITRTAKHWYGLNSSSVLEPIVRLYNITGEEKYLHFAKYIVNEGGCWAENIFKLAEAKKLRLYQYPVTKAYEMTSCFEGLLELYRVTGEEWYKTAILNFADLILEDEFTVIGSAGCTHELFDHSKVRQANTTNYYVMQETCVTVTLMKFFMQLNLFTGDPKYIDAYEISYYNGFLGSVNVENRLSDSTDLDKQCAKNPDIVRVALPFTSYSPLTMGTRGGNIGGLKVMKNNKYYGCCVCIAGAGIGSVHKTALMTAENGLVLNLYIAGTMHTRVNGKPVEIVIDTKYPAENVVSITVNNPEKEEFTLKLRNPSFSANTKIALNCNEVTVNEGYNEVVCKNEKEVINLVFDMPLTVVKPIPYGNQVLMNRVVWGGNCIVTPTYDEEDPEAKNTIALQKGPIMLAQDSRFGYDMSAPAKILDNNGIVSYEKASADFQNILTLKVKTENGYMTLCDYASSGKLLDEDNKAAVWIKNK